MNEFFRVNDFLRQETLRLFRQPASRVATREHLLSIGVAPVEADAAIAEIWGTHESLKKRGGDTVGQILELVWQIASRALADGKYLAAQRAADRLLEYYQTDDVDVADDEFQNWSDDELEEYAMTGARPVADSSSHERASLEDHEVAEA